MPHHVTQQGNRRQQTFFGEEDYQHYLELMARFCFKANLAACQARFQAMGLSPSVVRGSDRELPDRQELAEAAGALYFGSCRAVYWRHLDVF